MRSREWFKTGRPLTVNPENRNKRNSRRKIVGFEEISF